MYNPYEINNNKEQYSLNDRKKNIMPVQNEYLQNYQFNKFEIMDAKFNTIEQQYTNKSKKMPTDANILNRNQDIYLLQQQKPMVMDNSFLIPVDTRKEKYIPQINKDREPTAKVRGTPQDFIR